MASDFPTRRIILNGSSPCSIRFSTTTARRPDRPILREAKMLLTTLFQAYGQQNRAVRISAVA